jgi:anti-sigma-K factor RskA
LNISEYISTGILEAYVLGELSASERQEVEKHLAQYPELRDELRQIEETQEIFLQRAAITPRANLKEKILSEVTRPRQGKVIKWVPSYWRWVAAASIAMGLFVSYLAYDYRDKWLKTVVALNNMVEENQQIAQNYNIVNQKLDKIERDFSIIENTDFIKVVMKGTHNNPNALASVYWNPATQEAYLSIQTLREISRDNQFQLWAIVDGKPVDMGVFDENFTGLLKMKNVAGAQAFAVTIEPRGGKETPSLETMQVMGTLSKG